MEHKKLYYSTQETAERVGVEASTLRYWEKEIGSLLAPHRSPRGIRQYTDEDIETLKTFRYLTKEQGLSLAAAHRKLREKKPGDICTGLLKIRAELVRLRNDLTLPDDVD